MNARRFKHIYGPVPSRRLGRSLGIDLIPFKTCTYDCIYCHLGRTTHKTLERKQYVEIQVILSELSQALANPDAFDYISLAGSGEPTLNSGIGSLIEKIKSMTNHPVAVLTNGSLLWMRDIQDALLQADLILPSLDVGDNSLFQYVNRPHENISFEQIVDGLTGFSNRYKGEIWLEVLLLAGVTSVREESEKIASILRHMRLTRIQLNTVVRPPAEVYAKPVSRNRMPILKEIFQGKVDIISDIKPGNWHTLSGTDPAGSDVLSLLSRRPCTSADIAHSLGLHQSEALKYLDALVTTGKVTTVFMSQKTFYTTKGSNDVLRS